MRKRILDIANMCMDLQSAGHNIEFQSDKLSISVWHFSDSPISIIARFDVGYEYPPQMVEEQMSKVEEYLKGLI